MSRKKPPDSGATARNSPLAHRGDDLVQRQIRLLGNQSQQPLRVLLQRRSAASGRLRFGASGVAPPLQPFHRRTRAQIEVLGGLPSRSSRFDCLFDHDSRKSSEYGFGIAWAPKDTSLTPIRPPTSPRASPGMFESADPLSVDLFGHAWYRLRARLTRFLGCSRRYDRVLPVRDRPRRRCGHQHRQLYRPRSQWDVDPFGCADVQLGDACFPDVRLHRADPTLLSMQFGVADAASFAHIPFHSRRLPMRHRSRFGSIRL